MKVSELIKLLESKCKGDDPEVEFYSYEWADNLEELEYLKRYFFEVKRKNGIIKIFIDR